MRAPGGVRFMAVLFCFAMLGSAYAADHSLAEKCSSELQKVTDCLPFATGKAAAPSKDCCVSVTEIKDSDPACLCFLIEQIHNGSNPAVKSMGIQESRLLQLPSACKLANASISECPKLLNLPPNSPDAAIFTNTSIATTTPTTTALPTTDGASNGFWHKPQLSLSILLVPMAIIFSTGLVPS